MSSELLKLRFRQPLKAVTQEQAAGRGPAHGGPEGGVLRADSGAAQGASGTVALARGEAELARQSTELTATQTAVNEQMGRLGELIASVQQQKAEMLQANEEEIISLSLSIAEKVLQHEIENGRYRIGEVVRSTLHAIRSQGTIVVRANPRDYELTREAVESFEQLHGAKGVSIVADEAVPPASCCIETESGRISSEITERLKRIERGLLKSRDDSDGL